MKLFFDGATDTGLVRSANQDAYYLDPEGRFFIVADGMGGHAGGEEASRLATDAIRVHLESRWLSADSSAELLKAALLKANGAIIQDQLNHPQRSDMGTTAVTVIFRSAQSESAERASAESASTEPESTEPESTEPESTQPESIEPKDIELKNTEPESAKAESTKPKNALTQTAAPPKPPLEPWCAHVGDSRLYRLRGATLEQITEDHTWVNKASKLGVITVDQVKTHPWRHVLSQCLGRPDLNEISVQPIEFRLGDRLLMCSDGLTEEVSDHLIAELLKTTRACEKVTLKLIDSAKDNGGRDNITVIVIATDLQEPEA
ncbi:MAG: SpoIIE family protein phosphatase [Synechococcales cyanobacterium CRU_2_2]|nr:SpoIIE family protein phosphatase [Synechococcales cyanobacterium CRU_2_2]